MSSKRAKSVYNLNLKSEYDLVKDKDSPTSSLDEGREMAQSMMHLNQIANHKKPSPKVKERKPSLMVLKNIFKHEPNSAEKNVKEEMTPETLEPEKHGRKTNLRKSEAILLSSDDEHDKPNDVRIRQERRFSVCGESIKTKAKVSRHDLPKSSEPILSQGMPMPYSSIRTLQPNEALRSPKSTIPELQNVSKAAVILLILLLCANCLLYYKVWFLETTLVIDPNHPGSNSQRQDPFGPSSSFSKHLDPMLFLDKDPDSRTTEQWLEILQQQEMVHQLELEKWGEMLGTATELLRKTEDSLSNIQKSIQPLTLQKVRQMLLLQREHERPPKPAFEPPIESKPPVQQADIDESPQVKKPSEVQQPQPHVKSEL